MYIYNFNTISNIGGGGGGGGSCLSSIASVNNFMTYKFSSDVQNREKVFVIHRCAVRQK